MFCIKERGTHTQIIHWRPPTCAFSFDLLKNALIDVGRYFACCHSHISHYVPYLQVMKDKGRDRGNFWGEHYYVVYVSVAVGGLFLLTLSVVLSLGCVHKLWLVLTPLKVHLTKRQWPFIH